MFLEEESEEMSTCFNQVVTSQPGMSGSCHIRKHIAENFIIYQVAKSLALIYIIMLIAM